MNARPKFLVDHMKKSTNVCMDYYIDPENKFNLEISYHMSVFVGDELFKKDSISGYCQQLATMQDYLVGKPARNQNTDGFV